MNSSAYHNRPVSLMGIINVTDDSYFRKSRFLGTGGVPDVEAVLKTISGMLEDGADIIDIGACSSRPGSVPVGPVEEWRRLEPVLEHIAGNMGGFQLSIDTVWSEVAGKAYGMWGDGLIVNDVSAASEDSSMLPFAAEKGLGYIAMHNAGDASSVCDYGGDVVSSVSRFFDVFASRAASAGLDGWILDPGFGFSKTVDENWELLRNMRELRRYGKRILVGISRKRMIYELAGTDAEGALPATQAAHVIALQNGADILRVHDVAEASATVRMYRKCFNENL